MAPSAVEPTPQSSLDEMSHLNRLAFQFWDLAELVNDGQFVLRSGFNPATQKLYLAAKSSSVQSGLSGSSQPIGDKSDSKAAGCSDSKSAKHLSDPFGYYLSHFFSGVAGGIAALIATRRLTRIRSNLWTFQEKYPKIGSNPA